MTSLYATLRLVWRPLTLLQLAVTWMIVAFLLQVVPDVSQVVPVLHALWAGTATPGMVKAFWVVLTIAPAGIGLIVAMARIDLQHTTLAWHLPDARRRLLTGTLACAAAVALVLTPVMTRNAAPGATLAAFTLAAYAFLLPGFVFDVVVPRPARVLMALPFTAMVGWPGSTAALAHQHPFVVGALGAALAGLLLPAIASPGLARLRPFRWSGLRRSSSRSQYWESRKGARRAWGQSLASDRLVPWLRAAAHEAEVRFPLAHVAHAALAVLVTRLIDQPILLPILAGSFLMKSGLQLRTRMAYPLSRLRRAELAYAGAAIEAVTYFVSLGVLLYVTTLVSVPRLPTVDWEPSTGWDMVLVWGCSIALVPVAQWRALRWPDEIRTRAPGPWMLGPIAQFLVYGALVLVSASVLNRSARVAGDLGTALMAMGALLLVAQVTFAAAVYARFTRSDLLGPQGNR